MKNLLQGPGNLFVFSANPSARHIKFLFAKETVITGVIITTHLNFTLRTFTVNANTNPGDPHDFASPPYLLKEEFQDLTMYESDDYIASKRSDGTTTTIKRVFFFTYPVVAYKVKIHKMFGDEVIAIKVDFLGQDFINDKDPFKDGKVVKSKRLIDFSALNPNF